MKKISLKNVKETLSRKEMRVIAGGYDCLAGKFNAYVDAINAGFSQSTASSMSYSYYFWCMGQ